MKVLVDSSVWIEFFNPKPSLSLRPFEQLIQERRIVTCLPIKTEVLSGKMAMKMRRQVEQAFEAMDFLDLDWNLKESWNALVAISLKAQKLGISIPGLVDRMILACCLNSRIHLWTLDRKLQNLVKAFRQPLFQI